MGFPNLDILIDNRIENDIWFGLKKIISMKDGILSNVFIQYDYQFNRMNRKT